MATSEEIQAARKRVEDARELLAQAQERVAAAARDAENDILLADLQAEEARLKAATEAAIADAEHQEKANARRKGELSADAGEAPSDSTLATTDEAPSGSTPEQPPATTDVGSTVVASPTQPSFPGLGGTGGPATPVGKE